MSDAGSDRVPGSSATRSLPDPLSELPLIAARRPATGRIIGIVVVALIVAWIAWMIIVNPNIHWDVVVDQCVSAPIFSGLWVTIQLTVISMVIGIVIGVVIAIMQMSASPLLRVVAGGYSWFFRGTPLVQLLFWFNLGLLLPQLELGIPFDGPKLFGINTSEVITPFVAGLLGLSINEGAYMSQIVRAGILTVDPGQREVGMSRRKVLSRVVLPQAMRVIVPPTANQFISMLKTTSLVSVIAGADLLTVVTRIYLGNFEVVSMLVVASIWYLVLTTVASIGQHYLEQHFARGSQVAIRRRVLGNLRGKPGAGADRG